MSLITLKNISLIISGKKILSHISWQVREPEHWALIGANGSGKTMLLKIISGYQWPSQGRVEVLGQKFGEVDIRELRRQIGWVSSDLRQRLKHNFSAEEIVLSGLFASLGLYDMPNRSDRKSARELMEFMGVEKLAEEPFSLLSFGEQTRVLIARALITKPKLLLLDEPCVGLDLKAREKFLLFLQKLGNQQKGPTIIFTTHHIEEIMPFITHIFALKKGKVYCKGEKGKVMRDHIIKTVFNINLTIRKYGQRYWLNPRHD